MKTYSDELKAGIIAKMLPPNTASVTELSRETGIPKETLIRVAPEGSWISLTAQTK